MSADQIAGLALIAFGAAWYVRHLWRLWQEKSEATCRDMYRRARVAWTDAEAAELEAGIRADLHMDPVVDLMPLLPSPEASDEEFEAWVYRALAPIREDQRREAFKRTAEEIRRLPEVSAW